MKRPSLPHKCDNPWHRLPRKAPYVLPEDPPILTTASGIIEIAVQSEGSRSTGYPPILTTRLPK